MFLTGEFSQISRVSKRLLHYYDEIGLLKPANIDEATGYRYYSARQYAGSRLASPEEMIELVQHIQGVIPSRVNQRVLGPFAGIVYTDSFTLTNNDVELGYLLRPHYHQCFRKQSLIRSCS